MIRQTTLIALAVAGLAACNGDHGITGPAASAVNGISASVAAAEGGRGAVYTLMNLATGNSVAIFNRAADGTLTPAATVATGGTGTGVGLASQGAIALSEDGDWLYVVNAGSNDISVFRVDRGLTLTSRFGSGGSLPISLTVHDRLLYVLNAGGTGNITGFMLDDRGRATRLAGSTRGLSGAAATVAPEEISFNHDGHWLVVTEKGANLVDVYPVNPRGVAGSRTSYPAAGKGPYGFSFGSDDELFVSEAATGSASSYSIDHRSLTTVSGEVMDFHAAPCWLVVSRDGGFAYAANAHDGTISGFVVGRHGTLTLLDPSGTTATPGAGNLDLAFDRDGKFLYQLRSSGPITAYRVEPDGHLTPLGVAPAIMPGSVSGLAAR
jgi:6-phosphogluconolactonase